MQNLLNVKENVSKNKNSITSYALFGALALVMLAVFVRPGLAVVCGPVMTILFSYLFFSGHHEFVIAVILTANDALGTMIAGRLSFVYLLLLLVVVKLLCRVKLSIKNCVFFLISLAFILQLFAVGFIGIKMFFYTFIYLSSLVIIDFNGDKEATMRFFEGVAFAVVIIAIHALLTGGVEYYELSSSYKQSDELLRKGILGIGVGNSNYSGILLNIGTICIWFFTKLNKCIKCLCMLPILYAMLITNSLTGLIGLFLIVFIGILFGSKKKWKAFFVFAFVIVAIVLVYNEYIDLPENSRIPELDSYIERIEETIEELKVGDYGGATTNRTNLAKKYLNYIFFEQSALRMLFGGNTLLVDSITTAVTHNTFINLLLQFGVVGTTIFLLLAVVRYVKCLKDKSNPNYNGITVLKTFCVVAGLGASLYANNLWVFWMLALVLL